MMVDQTASRESPTANVPAMLAVIHALGLIVFLSWRFGGMEPLGRKIAECLCVVAPVITWLAWRQADRQLRRRFLRIALPLFGIAAIVLASALNPNMRVVFSEGQPFGFVPRDDHLAFLPSTVWPADTVEDFLLHFGLVLVGLNLFLAAPGRPLQRILLAVTAGNAAVLACAGSAFKLLRSTEILGAFPSPNHHFFATFFYYNHWGAFALLGAAAAAGLALHYRVRGREENWLNTPAPLLGVLVLLLLVSLALSGARASFAAGLCFALFLAFRLVPRRGSRRLRYRTALAGAVAIFGIIGAASVWLARDNLAFLLKKTRGQVADVQSGGFGDARLQVYRETWALFLQKPAFGWGWHSYRYVFRRVQSFDFKMQNEQKVKSLFLDAHNDWLQLLAELGVAGAVLSLATFVGIARAAAFEWWRRSPSIEVAAGVVCVGLLACVDFPFACPAVVVTAWALLMTAAAIAFDRERQSHTT